MESQFQTENKIKSIAMSLVLMLSAATLQSCSDEEFDTVVKVIAIAAIISTDSDTPSTNTRPPRYDECRDHQHDRYSYEKRCHHRRDGIPDRRHFSNLKINEKLNLNQLDLNVSEENLNELNISMQAQNTLTPAEIMASKYQLTLASAVKLESALDKAKSKDFSGVDEIGIAQSDLKRLYDNKKLSRYSYVNISAALGITFEEAKVLIEKMQSDILIAKKQLSI